MLKADLRKTYKKKRNELSLEEVFSLDAQLFEQLTQYDWSGINYLHCYLSIEKFKEYHTLPFIEWIWANHPEITIVVSKSDFLSNELRHFTFYRDTPLELNAYGIPEPVISEEIEAFKMDAVLTPLLVVDKNGNRVGYGKGFYDRFFASCKPGVKKLGISYFEPVEKVSDVNEWDVPMDVVFTPLDTYYLK